MKVLIITSTVKRNISVGKISLEMSSFLFKKNIDNQILFFSGNCKEKNCHRIRPRLFSFIDLKISQISNYRVIFTPFTIKRINNYIKKYKPDVIQLIQPLVRYVDNEKLFKCIGNTGLPCVYTMIDENAYLGDCDNAFKCKQFMKSCEHCRGENRKINMYENKISNWNASGSQRIAINKKKGYEYIKKLCFVAPKWVIERAKSSEMLHNRLFFEVDEYVNNLDVYFPRHISADEAKNKYNIDTSKKIILNVARYSNPRKGVHYFIELARKFECNNDYCFVNVGYDGSTKELPKNYLAMPFVANQDDLSELYSVADLAMITSLSDTMPNTSLEALSCGTPVCGFKITGIPYVAECPMGIFVKPGSVDELAKVVLSLNKKTDEMIVNCRKYALSRYSPEINIDKMINIYDKMINMK